MSRKRLSVLCVLVAVAVLGVSFGLSGCGGPKVGVREGTKSVTTPPTPEVSADLVWTHLTKAADEPQALFVVRLTNSSDTSASVVTMSVQALDKTGTIVGSGDVVMPTISPNSKFDYFGSLGGTAFSSLTGQPAKIKIGDVSMTKGIPAPQMLKNSELKLSKADASELFTEAAYAYDVSVKVTNDSGQKLNDPVRQQVVLYDGSGKPVGGDDGSSDNQPNTLDPGASYREEWTGVPAVRPAKSAVYSVWPE